MDKEPRPPKPWAPPGWKVYWSKRKTQWYWASPAKKTYWELPADMREPAELSGGEHEKVTAPSPPQTRSTRQARPSKRKRDEALIEEVVNLSPLNLTKNESIDPEPAVQPEVQRKPFDNHDISRMLSTLASIPGLGGSSGVNSSETPPGVGGTKLKDDGVVVAPPLDLSTLTPLESPLKPIAAPLSPLPPSELSSSHPATRARGDHYSERADALGNRSREEREDTPSIRMCKHNNWIKSILLEAGALIFGEGATFNAMDLACGRGGDLHKWRKVVQKFKQRIGVFYGIDNAPRALDHCRTVRAKQLPPSTQAHWLQEDLEQLDLFDRLASQGILHPGSIHLASMQFALHYFFRSEAALSAIFRLLASAMAEGGIFVTTYTDGNAVVRMAREQRWKDAIEAAKRNGGRPSYEPSATRVTSDLFSIQVASDTLHAIEESPDPFGHSFTFSLDNAVRHQKEFLVVDHVLDQVAQAFGFHPILDENFQPLTHDMMRVGSHQELMRIMKVFGKEPELHQAEWDAIGLYKAKIFVKDTSGGIFVPKAKEWIHRYLF